MNGRRTICVDFDGVLHAYTGWRGAHEYEGVVPGAIPWLRTMLTVYDVVILTTRGQYKGYRDDDGVWHDGCAERVAAWLIENGLSVDEAAAITVTNVKPPALVYIDDRAIRFTGSNYPSLGDIAAARPWWKR